MANIHILLLSIQVNDISVTCFLSVTLASYHQLPFKRCYQDVVSNAGFISTQNQIAELAGFDQKTKNPKIKLLKLKMLNKTSEGLI